MDFAALGDYAEHGVVSDGARFELFVKARRRFDALWIAGIPGPVVSIRLRTLLETVAGKCLEFPAVTVNEEPFWVLRVTKVVDALDVKRSEIDYTVYGAVKEIQRPVWRGDLLEDPLMFRVPQKPRSIWATPGVAAAYEHSHCDGLTFGPRGTVS